MTESEKTLGDISHTDPYTNRAFGETQTFGRGKTVAADGGEPEAVSEDEDRSEAENETLADVEHTVPEGGEGAQRTFDRGTDR